MQTATLHQFVERDTGRVRTERLFGDRLVRLLYHNARENAPILFRLLTSAWTSEVLAFVNYDLPFGNLLSRRDDFLRQCGIDLSECVDGPSALDTPRKAFERKIRYWQCRPMPDDPSAVVSPADARVAIGSLRETSLFFVKEKFFSFDELFGADCPEWQRAFTDGDFAVFRLTPDKYHYNHFPVSGTVIDYYELDGSYHSCNPDAVISVASPFSKNRRAITIIDTDVAGGTGIGLVAMIEVVALMIGDIVQCYSREKYDSPAGIKPGMFVEKGQPKSLYRPGSSTDILVFQAGRIHFAEDLIRNSLRSDVSSRFSLAFGRPLVETELNVRSIIAQGVRV